MPKTIDFFMPYIAKWTNAKVSDYGAQYYTFAIFGLINYPFALLYEYYVYNNAHGVYLRCFATFLCCVLLFYEKWNKRIKQYLALYWYCVITISVPALTIYLLLESQFSLGYLINFNIGAMIVILLVDWMSFLIIETLGIGVGLGIYYLTNNSIPLLPSDEYTFLFFYMFFCVVILGTIFTRNRELYANRKNKIKDELNFELENKVLERTRALEKALLVKTEFLNNMSHEIRTPIHAFSVMSETLYSQWDKLKDLDKKGYMKQVSMSANRLINLVGGLLDMSKYQEGKMFFSFHRVDLGSVVEGVIDECMTLYLKGKDIKIIAKKIIGIEVMADKERISQVLRNILVNSINYGFEGSEVEVRMKKGEVVGEDAKKVEVVHVEIRDNGVGIPEDEIEEIFLPFTQSSRTKTGAGGTGLGLSIAKEIVVGHHGKIWAENNKGKGATFHFLLPLR
jgi:signal transduction histidine kinase